MEENDKLDFDEGCPIPSIEGRSAVYKKRINPLISNKGKSFEANWTEERNNTHKVKLPLSKFVAIIQY